ncbi:MAG TPA: ArsA-related P-loop ATPase [Acidimicrobiales bacterium]|nr:ArsA-related P-loop ATPase [Acidimicrobiales bacterium]
MAPRALVAERSIVVTTGTGGVGKTTIAAALALDGARMGRRACVVTVDPAKRLADALGIGALGNTPTRIDGDWPGELWALMLDTKGTFDDLVHRYAATEEQARSILDNRLYRNISSALSGTQEYMAMEKLYELHDSGRFDLIVVDTPPTRHALDFLEAPNRLTRFLDNRIFRLLIMPTRAYLRAVSAATHAFLRTVSRVVGTEVVSDVITFFEAFEGMEAGFRDRAASVRELLSAPETAFALVTSPRRDAVEEASFFAARLAEADIDVALLVVNRLHPDFGGPAVPDADAVRAPASPLESLRRNLADFHRVAAQEEGNFAALADRLAPAPVVRVPFLPDDVHDLDGLALVAEHLTASG